MRLDNDAVYLDYNATTPIDPQVLERMLPYLREEFGNPSSSHPLGIRTREAVEQARLQLAKLVGCMPQEIYFTSSGSESNNWAIKGAMAQYAQRGQHLVISSVEHPAVSAVARHLMHHGVRVSELPVDSQGSVDPADLEEIITSKTVLVSVMHANNEVGTIQPIAELAEIAHRHGALFHTDAAQSAGKISIALQDKGYDLLSIAGHKLYAPKGIGVLYIKQGVKVGSMIHGAGHEHGRRAGTENVASIVALGAAAELALQALATEQQQLAKLRDQLQAGLKARFPELRVNAASAERLPNTLSISFPDRNALEIMNQVSSVLMSAGAACHSGDGKGSGVLEAMGVKLNYQAGTLRLSLGRFTDLEQIEATLKYFSHGLKSSSIY